jgi:crotonobetainyl-CoA:carnitine CoA-transferase CaiB-like acyl-CoA transferase
MEGPLTGTRVLDLSGYIAGPYCTRLLAGFGAEVIKVERPSGDPIRRWGAVRGADDVEASPFHLYLNQGKRSVVLDLETAEGRDALWRLIDSADVLVESYRPGTMARWGLDAASVARRKPDLLYVSITDFGQDGPYRDYAAWEITTYALSGLMSITGEPHREPLKNGGYLGQYVTGHKAFDAILVGLWERGGSGLGQHLDISVHECVASLLEHFDMQWIYAHTVPPRAGNGARAAWGLYPAADGWVGVVSGPARRWANIGVLMESEELQGERYLAPGAQTELRDEIDALMLPWLVTHNKEEIYHRAQALGLPFGYAATPADLFDVEQLQYRHFFERIDHPVAGSARYPTIAAHFTDGLWSLGRAPLLGEHTAEVLAVAGDAATAPARGERIVSLSNHEPRAEHAPATARTALDPYARKGPLEDVLILDCSMVWAGPYATKLLGDMGATIVKVEAARHMDSVRGLARPVPGVGAYPDNDPGAEPWNRAGYYNKLNRNKLSLCMDILDPAGREVFLELAAKADVVLENFGGGVFTRMGYSLEALQAVNPDVILVSMPPSGNGGPEGKYVGYGVAIEQLGGIVARTGYTGDIPMKTGINYGDPIAGIHAAGYIMTALLHRRRTGRGGFVDLSQREAAIMWLGEEVVECELTGAIPERIGNRDEYMAPSGVYRCAPDAYTPDTDSHDAWVGLATGSAEEWRALATVIGHPELASDPAYATVEGRRARHDAIDALITAWTSQRTPDEAMTRLQAAGVPAGAVADMRRVVEDPQLRARGFWPEVDQPSVGRHVIAGVSWHFDRTPGEVRWAAPNLGQHSDYVLRTILGKRDAEIEALRATGVLANTPLDVA